MLASPSRCFELAMSNSGHFGKYRATVFENRDPEGRGRLQLIVPEVFGNTPSAWAEACSPLAGPAGARMGIYFVPPNGTPVWAEFEQGNSNLPIWSGCRWSEGSDVPAAAQSADSADANIVLQSMLQHEIVISDAPPTSGSGGIVLRSADGAMIVVNETGIHLSNGQGASISLEGPSVTVNFGALVVT